MKRAVLVLLALGACKKSAPPPATPEHVAADAPDSELTCEDVANNPVIAAQRENAQKFLEVCHDYPDTFTQPLRRCLRDAKSEDALDQCGDDNVPDKAEGTKRSEAEVFLDAIKKGAKAYYADHAAFPAGSEALAPPVSCCDSGRTDRKCEPDASLWGGAWGDLDFLVDEPGYFRYAYEGDGATFTASAVGDLDCDEAEMTYTLVGNQGDGGPMFTLTRPDRTD